MWYQAHGVDALSCINLSWKHTHNIETTESESFASISKMYHTKAFFLNNQNFIKMRLQRLDPGGNTRKLSKDRLTTDKYNVT